jgi:hypothetical protein
LKRARSVDNGLEALLADKQARLEKDAATRKRVAAEVSARMDTGVRPNPALAAAFGAAPPAITYASTRACEAPEAVVAAAISMEKLHMRRFRRNGDSLAALLKQRNLFLVTASRGDELVGFALHNEVCPPAYGSPPS